MKRFCFIIAMFVSLLYVSNVFASSIDYTLKIDSNRHFYETITYTIEKDTTNEYLKYVLNNKLYFDIDNKYLYKKTVTTKDGNSIVILKHDYPSADIKKSKLLNTCFEKFVYKENDYRVTYYASDPFVCINKADKITINVIPDLEVILDTAEEVVGNKYTWHPVDDKFLMDLSLGQYDPNDKVGAPIADTNLMVNDGKMNVDHPAIDVPFSYTPVIIISVFVVAIVIVISMKVVSDKKSKKRVSQDDMF